ncbi:MAG TPA: MFS transporter [Thermomicrobiales bacterium]|nr:MFS transporter [Thermomicrobiales bacterium]
MFAILRNRDFGLLWLAGLISLAGTRAFIIALPIHVYRLTDSTLATAGAFAASFLPGILFGSLAGVFVDRWDRKTTMVVSNVVQALLLLPILAAPDSLTLLYTIAAVQGTVGLFFSPAESAFLPTLVGKDKLVAANAMNSLNDNLALLIGPATGAMLYAQIGFAGAAMFDAASYAIAAVLIRLIAASGKPERMPETPTTAPVRTMLDDWKGGMRVIRNDTSLKVLFAAFSFNGVAEGVFLSLGLAPLVLDVLGGTAAQVGWLATIQAVGGIVAGIIIVRIGHRFSLRWLIGGGMIGLGLADFCFFNSYRLASPGNASVAVAMVFMALAGLPAVAGASGRQTLVQEQTTDAFRGRVFGALRSAQGLTMLVGLAIGGVFGDSIGLVPVLSASAIVRMLGGVLAFALLPSPSAARQHLATSPQAASAKPD